MSVPTEIDFAVVLLDDPATTADDYKVLCGITDVNINETANTTDRFRRDCAKPGVPGSRFTKSNGKQLDITGSGASNADEIITRSAALGVVRKYHVELYQEDATDTGKLLGTIAGSFRMTANNLTTASEGEGSGEITLANHGPWTYTAASVQ